jgi:RNA polymerase sigma-70 factor (sigma-E family)
VTASTDPPPGAAESGSDDPAAHEADVVQLRSRSGRDREFDVLYRSEHLAMLRLGFLLTGNRDAAAEVVHDAFIRTYQRWERLDRPGAYLRTSVVNGCNDHHRRRIRRATFPVAEFADRHDPSADRHDEHLADAIAHLRPKRRAAIVLRYYLDLPQREIAEALGVRQGTVKSLLHRGLADLRDALSELPEGPGSARLRSTGAAPQTAAPTNSAPTDATPNDFAPNELDQNEDLR